DMRVVEVAAGKDGIRSREIIRVVDVDVCRPAHFPRLAHTRLQPGYARIDQVAHRAGLEAGAHADLAAYAVARIRHGQPADRAGAIAVDAGLPVVAVFAVVAGADCRVPHQVARKIVLGAKYAKRAFQFAVGPR